MAERTDFYGSNTPKCRKSPCSFQKTSCSFHSFEPILSKRAKKKSPENRLFTGLFGGELGIRTLGSFWEHSISSAAPSTTRTTLRVCNSAFLPKNVWKELTERTTKYSIFEPEKTPEFTGFLSGANSQLYKKFRVRPVMTTSITLRIRFC